MLQGQLQIDRFAYAFFNGQVHTPEDGPAPVNAKIVRINTESGVVVELVFRREHWDEFQRLVQEAGPVASVLTAPAGALNGLPTIDQIIGSGRNGSG